MKILGYILSIGGLVGVIFFTYEYMQESESFEVLGADVAVSTGDWIPIVISALVMVVGILMSRGK
ncbi:hypothetical protein DYD21_00030 [Rhodohalobacter sp. SW132]|uniref:hypothetical protein n=1 Tax=Rhodohalobacter sp. SW132 TaxID=2293433 RepID=UPI000E230571|nr:hypothetical protein [Rhodohalobacter sp. SW132]REL38382.1 hypothetical protein DYD21_00030 [Rhodohalobacter sp. SW132]